MKKGVNQARIFVLMMILILWGSEQAFAQKQIQLATSEREPYIGKSLPNQGYVHELVTEAFKRVGYEVVIQFYPLERAKRLAENGEVDGLIPSIYDKSLEEKFTFSAPFPGGNIGLLKRKSLSVSYAVDPRKNLTEFLRGLEQYTFGLVRGTAVAPVFDQAEFFRKQLVPTDIQNIDMLGGGRIDFAVIDNYTAADLIVNQRPHLIGQLEFMYPPLVSNDFHVAFSKKSESINKYLEEFNRGLAEVIRDKTLDRILAKHGLTKPREVEKGKKIVRMGIMNLSEMGMVKELSHYFEKANPNIEIEWVVLEEDVLLKRLMSDLAISDGRFDVMMVSDFDTKILAKRGWLYPLRDIAPSYDLDDLLESVKVELSYNNELHALPFYTESSFTMYRKDLFEKAGVTMPENPTYDDILRLAKAVHDPENGVYGIAYRTEKGWSQGLSMFTTMLNSFGGRWFDQNWNPQLDSPEWKETLHFYIDLISKYGPPNKAELSWKDCLKYFQDGKVAIVLDATSFAGRILNPEVSKVHDNVGFAYMPVKKTIKGAYWFWSWALAIPSTSTNYDESLKVISWITSKEVVNLIGDKYGWVAVPSGSRKSTLTNEKFKKASPFADVMLEALKKSDPTKNNMKPVPYTGSRHVVIPEYRAIGNAVSEKLVDAINGKISEQQALKESQEIVSKLMRQSGYIN